jgi:hypothetical protein
LYHLIAERREWQWEARNEKLGSRGLAMFWKTVLLCSLAAGWLNCAEKYTGPIPPKPDIPYLLHASNLVETEVGEARQENHKNDVTFTIAGAASPARTPLAEPIFIIDARNISPERFELYRVDVKGGNREVSASTGRRRGRALHLTVKPLSNHLYRIEADEALDNGEYLLTLNGDNKVFCFEIY